MKFTNNNKNPSSHKVSIQSAVNSSTKTISLYKSFKSNEFKIKVTFFYSIPLHVECVKVTRRNLLLLTAQNTDENDFLKMTESNLDPEIIKKTQDSLGKYVKKPPLTEKLLKKPPFKFIHDVIKVVRLNNKDGKEKF